MYPILTRAIKMLTEEHYGNQADKVLKSESEWIWPSDAAELEVMINKLDYEELTVFVVGMSDEAEVIEAKYDIKPVQDFINAVFDGSLHFNFYNP